MEFYLYNKDQKTTLPTRTRRRSIDHPSTYIPSDELVSAVNVALRLQQPLLLTGEPGTGKTRLANHVAYIFDLGEPLVFNAKTTSSVKDLFYRYDALGHFQYSQTHAEPLSPEALEKNYIHYEALGKAIRAGETCVVLIDEIDKAPRDLPNDILSELETLSFRVPEINKTYTAPEDRRPIIIMTSNSEKNLPDAFLRRVTYYHIEFPDTEALMAILQRKFDGYGEEELRALIEHFQWLRSGKTQKLQKNPATAELIYWAQLLLEFRFNVQKLGDLKNLTQEERQQLSYSYSVLAKTKEDLAVLKRAVG